ncbi:MAG: glycosyltransferase [Anaerolineae bacterium]
MAELDIMVCAFNEEENLPRLLKSLQEQTVLPDRFRVVLVDNNSTDDTVAVAQSFKDSLHIDIFTEPRSGKNYACNTGLAQCTTPYIACTDADVKVETDWVEKILAIAEQDRPHAFCGPYRPYHIQEPPEWYRPTYNSKDLGAEPRDLRENEFVSGPNMVWRRDVLEQIDGFRVDVGLVKRGLARGDETNVQVRAQREIPGFVCRWYPELVVYHLTRPETYSLWYWTRRMLAMGYTQHQVNEKRPEDVSSLRAAARALREAARYLYDTTIGTQRRDRDRYPYPQNYYYEHTMKHLWELGGHLAQVTNHAAR